MNPKEPAFPVMDTRKGEVSSQGMSLRDYFAAAAITGLMTDQELGNTENPGMACEIAYAIADSMMKARKK